MKEVVAYADGEPIYSDREVDDREHRQREAGACVYFIQARCGGPIKIGWSCAADIRLRTLQEHTPFKLEITRTLDGGTRLERELHKRFADARIKGEWFEPVPELVELAEARADLGTPEFIGASSSDDGWERLLGAIRKDQNDDDQKRREN